MMPFAVGDEVETIHSPIFNGHVGRVKRIRHVGASVYVWVLFPTHPWHEGRQPFFFTPDELRLAQRGRP